MLSESQDWVFTLIAFCCDTMKEKTYLFNFGRCEVDCDAGFENPVLLLTGMAFFLALTTWVEWALKDLGLLLFTFRSSIISSQLLKT